MKAYGGADSDESDTEVVEVDVDKLPLLDIGPDEHKLQYTYCLWYHRGSYKIKNPSVSIRCTVNVQICCQSFNHMSCDVNFNKWFVFVQLTGLQQIIAFDRPMCKCWTMVGPLLSFDTSVNIEAISWVALIQEWHQSDVGRSTKCQRWQMGDSFA